MEAIRSGRQEPTTSFVLPYETTDGETAVDLYELTGRTALDWQRILIYDILGKNPDGLWVHTTYGYSVPRQNGKGEILLMRELYGLATGERILHTAHLTSTSHAAWERLIGILDRLGVEYKSIKAKGQERIDLVDGGKVEFRTRTNTGGLGESYDLLIIDEAQEYQTAHQTALKYVISASKNPQTIMCGTPPTPISSGTVFKTFRTDVLFNEKENCGWADWAVDELSDVRDKDLWYRTNPSLGYHLQERTVADEVGTDEATIIDFNIQRLGLWIKYNQQSAISKTDWEKTLVKKLPKFVGKMNIGIKYEKDGETVSMAVGLKTEDGKIFVECITNRAVRDGMDYFVEFLKQTKEATNKIVIDGTGNQQILVDELKKQKIRNVVLPTVKQIKKANAAFEKAIFDQRLCHMEQPSLTKVVTNCEKRVIGSDGGFGYKAVSAEDDISLLDSVMLACWATEEYPTRKKQKIVY